MRIREKEKRYEVLRHNFEVGFIDETTFTAKVDQLSFQDRWGRYWIMGVKSGAWYYHDGQAWRRADPRQAHQSPPVAAPAGPEVRPDNDDWVDHQPQINERLMVDSIESQLYNIAQIMLNSLDEVGRILVIYKNLLLLPAKSMVMVGAVFFMVLVLLAWPVSSGPPAGGPLPAPSPRPPVDIDQPDDEGGGDSQASQDSSDDDDDDGDSGGPRSAIFGSVTDLSTDRPGAGVEVVVNGQVVRTDTEGKYSITGLNAGEYTVAPQLDGQGAAAHEPVSVELDGQSQADDVDLAYYSQPTPAPVERPEPATLKADTSPGHLPVSGAAHPHKPGLLMGGGLLLILGGILWKVYLQRNYAAND